MSGVATLGTEWKPARYGDWDSSGCLSSIVYEVYEVWDVFVVFYVGDD